MSDYPDDDDFCCLAHRIQYDMAPEYARLMDEFFDAQLKQLPKNPQGFAGLGGVEHQPEEQQ